MGREEDILSGIDIISNKNEQHSLNDLSGCRNTLSTLEKQRKKLFCLSFNNFIH